VRTIGDHPPSRKQAGEMLFQVLHHLGEKYWRYTPDRMGAVEVADLLKRLGERDWRSAPSHGGTVDCRGVGGLAPTSW
jgi:hypothetical protein